MAEIARQLNLPHQTVSATVRGVKNNREVLKALRDMGCPLDALSLPDELKNDRSSKAS
ncbi:hypothetical protein [Desulfovibrio psychrotolerans]|nr:hypothetical protein [Desulfovibrio psychrotolerans]